MHNMESWINEHGGTSLSDETLRPVSAHEISIVVNCKDVAREQGLVELAFYKNAMKAVPNDLLGGLASNVSDGGVSSSSSCLLTLKATFGEEESSSMDRTVTDCCARASLLMDLKLGMLTGSIYPKNSTEDPRVLSSSVLRVPVKQIRSTSLNDQTAVCQVYGCCVDLTYSKDYHKRHKVCDVHSKTAKVIVDGTEQRFCQQCSRFHLLGKFDSAKRSCRRSLAGHNKRRKKSHLNHSRIARQSHDGCRFMGTILPGQTSFFCPDTIPNWTFGEAKYENSESGQHANLCDETMSVIDGQSVPELFLSSHGAEQKLSLVSSINIASGSFSSSAFDDESTVKCLSEISDLDCALSLLSSQSQSSCTYSSGIPIARSLAIKDKYANHASTSVASNKFSSSGLNSIVEYHTGYLSSINTLEFEDGDFQGFEFVNTRDPLFHEDGPTVDILQLSSLLQNAEQQRQSVEVKQECEVFSSLPIN